MKSLNFALIVCASLFFPYTANAESIEELLSLSDKAIKQSSYSTALIHLKNAAKQDSGSLGIRLKLAELFIHTGQGLQAQIEIDKAIRLDAKPSETAVLLAKAKLLQGEFELLTDQIQILELPQSKIAQIRAIQGHALFEERKFDQSAQMFQRAISLDPQPVEVQLGLVKLHRMNKQVIKETDLIESLLTKYPENPEVLITAGNFYRLQGAYDQALKLFNRAGEIQESNVNIWYGKVRTHISNRKFKSAKDEIQKVLVNYPEHQVGNYLLATIAYQEREYDRAKSAIQIVLKGKKRKFEALQLLSTIQFELGEYTEAEQNLAKYLKFHPNDFQAQKTLAAIYLKRKQGVKALQILKKLESLDDAYIYSMMATAFITIGNTEKADLYINKSLNKAPDNEVIQRHFQKSKLESGQTIDITFTDNSFENYYEKGHIPLLNILRQKNYDEALRIINGYMKKMPNSALMHYLLGSTYLYKKQIPLAKENLIKALEINSKFHEARIYLAKIYQIEGDERNAEKEYREVLNIDKSNDQAMVALAGIYHRSGDKDEMFKWLNRSRKTNSASLASREVLERNYRENGDLTNALKVSEEMVAIQPQNIDLLEKLSINQKRIGRIDLAIQTFKKIVDLQPKSPKAHFGLGQLSFMNGNYNDAKESFIKVLEFRPDNITAKVVLIEIALKTKNLSQALEHARELQQVHPDKSASYDMLGDVYIAMGNPDIAIKNYKKSVSIEYRSETYLKLFSSYNLNNQFDLGISEIKKWIKNFPEDLNIKEALAITYQRNRQNKEANALYQEIIEKGRTNDRVLNNLALVSLEMKNPMSMEYADMAYNLAPQNPKNKDTLGWVLFNNNQKEKGALLLKEAVELSPNNPDIRYHYAVTLADSGKTSEAINQLYLAISNKNNFINLQKAEELMAKIRK